MLNQFCHIKHEYREHESTSKKKKKRRLDVTSESNQNFLIQVYKSVVGPRRTQLYVPDDVVREVPNLVEWIEDELLSPKNPVG